MAATIFIPLWVELLVLIAVIVSAIATWRNRQKIHANYANEKIACIWGSFSIALVVMTVLSLSQLLATAAVISMLVAARIAERPRRFDEF